MAEVGSWVWIPDDIGKDYVVPGEILAINGDGITAKLENGQVSAFLIDHQLLTMLMFEE
mgnify:CR=1 FL=1